MARHVHRWTVRLAVAVAVISFFAGVPAQAQKTGPDSTAGVLQRAVTEYEADHAPVAQRLLLELIDTSPEAFEPSLGSAAFWLGRLYWDQGRRAEAIRVWQDGWKVLGERRIVDVRLGDRLVSAVFAAADTSRYEMAASVYLELLAHLETADSLWSDAASHILVPLRLILPDSLKATVALAGGESALRGSLAPGAGRRLVEWWNGMDALPATARNERLIEHLRRVSFVFEHYGFDGPMGFDDRGSVYIRFGPASRTKETRLNPFDYSQTRVSSGRGIRTLLSTTVPALPRNEFWVYPEVGREAQFLFIERARGEYRLGSISDLIPRYLRSSRYARLRLSVLEGVLRDLALYHPWTYSAWYGEVANYLSDLELDEISAELDRAAGRPGLRMPLLYAPHGVTDFYMGYYAMEEQRVIKERDDKIPPAFFDDFGELVEIPVVVRVARFLNGDGSTRIEIYWTAPIGEFARAHRRLNHVDRERVSDFLVDVSLTEYDSVNTRRAVRVVRNRVNDVRLGDRGVVFPQTLVRDRFLDGRRLALQWDVRPIPAGEEDLRYPEVGIAVARLDSLTLLSGDRRVLEMSDLKPILVQGASAAEGPPYPGGVLTPELNLGLQFEIYHLTFGSDDRTHYEVSYELEREEEISFRTRERQAPESKRIAASSRYDGSSSTERETIVLDLTGWDAPGHLHIIVRVRDDTSGQEVTRALDFDLKTGA